MGIKVQVDFIGRATVQIRAYVYDDDDALVDPTSCKVTILDPDGTTIVDAASMTPLAATDGIYDYFYNTTSATAKGAWSGEVVTVDGSGDTAKTTIASFGFRIK